jgi:hypothetical protein
MEATKVGIREFRADMAEFIASSTPIAVTRHGQTIGYFIPTHLRSLADMTAQFQPIPPFSLAADYSSGNFRLHSRL